VRDTLRAHKTTEVRTVLDQSSFAYRYLPAYRPDLNGIVNLSPLATLESNILSPSTLVLKFSKHATTCFRIEVAENCFRIG